MRTAAERVPMKGIGAVDNGRERFARALAEVRFDAAGWFAQLPPATDAVQRVVLAAAPVTPLPPGTTGLEAVRLLTQDPVYQLK